VLLLGLDTATSAVTVAVCEGGRTLAEVTAADDRRHGELLAPAIESVLSDAGITIGDLGAIAVGVGPGPFTGLRVGLVTARMLGAVLDVPVHGVCTLDALALDAGIDGPFRVATDARRKEVYWARYGRRGDRAVALDQPAVDRPAELASLVRRLPTAGRGPVLYPDLFPAPLGHPLDVDPGWLARVASRRLAAGAPMPVEPLYLRRPDALTTAERGAS
jgi:tRNA threonylcarbamoyladenosine biosynthesis protein TsaB